MGTNDGTGDGMFLGSKDLYVEAPQQQELTAEEAAQIEADVLQRRAHINEAAVAKQKETQALLDKNAELYAEALKEIKPQVLDGGEVLDFQNGRKPLPMNFATLVKLFQNLETEYGLTFVREEVSDPEGCIHDGRVLVVTKDEEVLSLSVDHKGELTGIILEKDTA